MSTEEQLLEDLRAVGVSITSVWDLVNGPNNYHAALPVLVRHLESAEDIKLKEGIVRALGVKGFDDATDSLIKEFTTSKHEGYKWAVANTLSIIAPSKALDQLIEIMADTRHGMSRQMIAEALGQIRDKASVQVLLKCLGDNEVAGHAVVALGRIGDASTIEQIKPFLKHDRRWIRKAAETALRRIERKGRKTKGKRTDNRKEV